MTDRLFTAKALRDANTPYSAIGAELGVSRQRAYAMVRQAENIQAFTNANAPRVPSVAGGLMAEPTMPAEGSKPMGVFGTRQAFDLNSAGGWNFSRLLQVLEALRQGYDPHEYYALAEEMLERDPNIRSLMDIRVAQTANQKVLPALGPKALLREKTQTESAIAMLYDAGLKAAIEQALWARHNSVAIFELDWLLTATERVIKAIIWRDPKHFVFDRQDPRKLYIKPAVPGGALTEAPAGQFIAVFSNGKPGTPIRGGLAVPAAWLYVKSQITDYDWTKFLNRYGKSAPSVEFPADMKATPKEIAEARRLASQVGSDTAIVLTGGVKLNFNKDSTVLGSSEAFERKLRYEDEQKSKLYLGGALATGTGNTGSGGTQSLGAVQAENKFALQKADATLPEALINEALYWHAVFNKGEGAFIPKASLQLDEPVDMSAIAGNAKIAADMGLPLSISALAQMLGMPLAETPEDTLNVPKQAAPAADKAAKADKADKAAGLTAKACPVHSPANFAGQDVPRDAIDDLADAMLADYERTTPDIDAVLAEAVLNAGSVDAAIVTLLEVVKTGDVAALQALFTSKRTAVHVAGKLGGEV